MLAKNVILYLVPSVSFDFLWSQTAEKTHWTLWKYIFNNLVGFFYFQKVIWMCQNWGNKQKRRFWTVQNKIGIKTLLIPQKNNNKIFETTGSEWKNGFFSESFSFSEIPFWFPTFFDLVRFISTFSNEKQHPTVLAYLELVYELHRFICSINVWNEQKPRDSGV